MKINVAFPATGCQKLFEINDEIKVSFFCVFLSDVKVLHLTIDISLGTSLLREAHGSRG